LQRDLDEERRRADQDADQRDREYEVEVFMSFMCILHCRKYCKAVSLIEWQRWHACRLKFELSKSSADGYGHFENDISVGGGPSFLALIIFIIFWRQRERERERADSLFDQVSDLKDKVSGLRQLLQGSKEEMREVTEERDRLLREASELRAAESESKKQQCNITFELEEVKLSCAKALQTAAGHEETCRYSC
jgi:regulator of replication initiation timing